MDYPESFIRKLLFIRISTGDAEQVEGCLGWAKDEATRRRLVNERTKKGTPAIVRSVRGPCLSEKVTAVLIRHGADPSAMDAKGLTALDHVRRRLLKYEGRPRIAPPKSPSLTAGGEVILNEFDLAMIEQCEKSGDMRAMEIVLDVRRKGAERVFDPRSELERALSLLERHQSRRS